MKYTHIKFKYNLNYYIDDDNIYYLNEEDGFTYNIIEPIWKYLLDFDKNDYDEMEFKLALQHTIFIRNFNKDLEEVIK